MTTFWIFAGLMVGAAFLFLLPPLLVRRPDVSIARDTLNVALYKDRLAELDIELANEALSQEQYDQARNELRRDLLVNVSDNESPVQEAPFRGRWVAVVVAIFVPLASVGMYQSLGSPELALTAEGLAERQQQQARQSAGEMMSIIEKLQQRLEANPSDVEGWLLLGRSLVTIERYSAAAEAMANAYALASDRPDITAEYAEILAIARGGDFTGRPLELINRALAADPEYDQALWLAGVAAFQRGAYRQAVDYWSRLLGVLPQESEAFRIVQSNLEQARQRMMDVQSAAPGAGRVEVRVALAPALAGQVTPSDRVFVFARPKQGPPMPVAIVELRVADLPAVVTLNDETALAMGSDAKLSDLDEVTVVARVSKGGDAMPKPGDLEGAASARVGSGQAAAITIDRVLP